VEENILVLPFSKAQDDGEIMVEDDVEAED
jgi:hypothetical protein